ncbi:hypothetical protein BofuT4_uP109260.1 [Botrytis cinerea T4]|uniref:Uncharacterized protein n=1 Tax=Botryotinia fuckeliana (strain T4) TaxID=999810 RepID=G2Y7E0_BOTF4|nr:hypothetical protein BofuT4_uP109260.1 [Botrytis cinerea T4]
MAHAGFYETKLAEIEVFILVGFNGTAYGEICGCKENGELHVEWFEILNWSICGVELFDSISLGFRNS